VIEQQAKKPPLPITGKFAMGKQKQLATEIMRAIGFPFERGRLDESEHPFTEGVPGISASPRGSIPAIRSPDCWARCMRRACHVRPGAAQGLAGSARGTRSRHGTEESQSLLLEMILGRSRAFVNYLKPLLDKHFGVSGPEWEVDNLYRHLNRVRRGLIRVDADELTYPLHIMLRYDLEKRILGGELAVRDVPEAWNTSWSSAWVSGRRTMSKDACRISIGRWDRSAIFPPIALGAIIAAQLWESLNGVLPGLELEIASGQFGGLFGWLRDHVHGHGARVSVQELMKDATDKPLSAASSLRYLEAKYLESQ